MSLINVSSFYDPALDLSNILLKSEVNMVYGGIESVGTTADLPRLIEMAELPFTYSGVSSVFDIAPLLLEVNDLDFSFSRVSSVASIAPLLMEIEELSLVYSGISHLPDAAEYVISTAYVNFTDSSGFGTDQNIIKVKNKNSHLSNQVLQDGYNYFEFSADYAGLFPFLELGMDLSIVRGDSFTSSYTIGKRMSMLVKMPEGKLWFAYDGTWLFGATNSHVENGIAAYYENPAVRRVRISTWASNATVANVTLYNGDVGFETLHDTTLMPTLPRV